MKPRTITITFNPVEGLFNPPPDWFISAIYELVKKQNHEDYWKLLENETVMLKVEEKQ